jgi:hypothetical protein
MDLRGLGLYMDADSGRLLLLPKLSLWGYLAIAGHVAQVMMLC